MKPIQKIYSQAVRLYMGPKFKLTDESYEVQPPGHEKPHTVYRIKALRDIPERGVKQGDFGGLIETEYNLSHDGCSWVDRNSAVVGKSSVVGNGLVQNGTLVYGGIEVSGVVSETAVGGDTGLINEVTRIQNGKMSQVPLVGGDVPAACLSGDNRKQFFRVRTPS